MTTQFNLPRIRRDPLGQALDRLPQFLLALGRLQEDKKEREQRASRANEQDRARKEASEIQLVGMAARGSDADVKAASIPSLRRSVTTPAALKAIDVLESMAREQQKLLRKQEKEQTLKEASQGELDKLSLYIKAAATGAAGADSLVTVQLDKLARLGGLNPPSDQDTTQIAPQDTLTTDPLNVLPELRTAGFGGETRRQVSKTSTIGQLFNVSDPTTVGGLVTPGRKIGPLVEPEPFSVDTMLKLLNANR